MAQIKPASWIKKISIQFGGQFVNQQRILELMFPLESDGTPDDVITPDFPGQTCVDTTNGNVYKATTALASGWVQANNA